nr:MAG TPA: hypothetical protein [Caudoviricetes sp.]
MIVIIKFYDLLSYFSWRAFHVDITHSSGNCS